MIITLTANPSVDRTIEVAALERGSVIRAGAARVDPGGKGVNISRALTANGRKTRAVLPSGGAEGGQLATLLADHGIEAVLVPVRGPVRANISVVEPDGTVTKLNEPGPVLSGEELAAVAGAVRYAATGADWVVLAGSLPTDAPASFYLSLLAELRPSGARLAVDTGGAALVIALAGRPDLVKPNRTELADAANRAVHTLGDVVLAAQILRRLGARAVLASLGPDGAVLVDDDGARHGEAPVARPRSDVGAGDAALAGFLAVSGAGGTGPEALRAALAWGAAAVSLPGSGMPEPRDIDLAAVHLHDRIDIDRLLTAR